MLVCLLISHVCEYSLCECIREWEEKNKKGWGKGGGKGGATFRTTSLWKRINPNDYEILNSKKPTYWHHIYIYCLLVQLHQKHLMLIAAKSCYGHSPKTSFLDYMTTLQIFNILKSIRLIFHSHLSTK